MISNQAISVSPSSKLAFRLRKDGARGWGPIIGNRGRGGTRGMHHIDAQHRRQGDPPCGKWLVGFNFPIHSITHRIAEHRKESPLQSKLSGRASIYAASEHAYAPEPKGNNLKDLWATVTKELDAFCHFSRPHTVIGTIVGITSVSILPVESITDISPIFFFGLLKALLPAVLMNIYVVGLNQLYDVEIDKVNKPSLPLASGEYSMEKGIAIVTTCFILSFAMGIKSQSPPLLSALLISFLLGSAYSINLPFLRWKQHAFLAASCILCVRAILVQIAFFLHMQRYVLRRPAILTKPVLFATVFMCFFSAVIALFKDIPDVDGDRDFGIQSFSVHLGQERVFWLCIKLLTTAYVSAMLVGASSSNIFQKLVTVLGHGLLAFILWLHAQSLDIQNKASITSFYMFIWKLFYAEYFLIPFVH